MEAQTAPASRPPRIPLLAKEGSREAVGRLDLGEGGKLREGSRYFVSKQIRVCFTELNLSVGKADSSASRGSASE